VLVAAAPLQVHRAPRQGTRDQRHIEGRIVGAVVPVAAGAHHVHHPQPIDGHAQRLREGLPQHRHARAWGFLPHFVPA
jgi:hypothetical protein